MNFASITDYLEYIFDEFKAEISGMDTLCDLRNVSFEGGNLPDYNNRAQALLYCLRYHFGYAFEYKHIYQNYILNNFNHDHINVLSIGCGNGIDLWSLDQAINCSNTPIKSIIYLGVDRVDWGERFECSPNDQIEYYQGDVQKLPACTDNVDVVIFPKSLSELADADLSYLSELINESTNEVIISASFRTDTNNLNRDSYKFNNFIKMFIGKGFEIAKGETGVYYTIDGLDSIYKNDPEFYYPNHVKEFVIDLYYNCDGAYGNRCSYQNICSEQLTRQPILNKNFARFNVIKLSR